ncbi:hypothetical protein DND01_13010 [Escherichia albertii]|nr:hypothetical protein [Escherichia albertii]
MVRAEGWFTVFGRIGVIPSQLLPSCLGKIDAECILQNKNSYSQKARWYDGIPEREKLSAKQQY